MSDETPNKKKDGEGEDERGAAIGSGFKEQTLGGTSDWGLARRMWRYMRPYKWTFFLCVLLLPIISGLSLVQPYLLQIAIDDHLVAGKLEGLGLIAALFGVAIVSRAVVEFVQIYLMQKAGQRAIYDLRREIFDHTQTLSVRFFQKNPIGRLMTRMTTDVESLQEALSSGMVTMIGDLFTLGAIVVILLYKDWRLALVGFTVVPPLLAVTALFRHFLRTAFREIRVRIARLNSHLQESVTGMSVIQLFVRERVSAMEYADINQEHRTSNIRSIRYDAMLYAVVEAVGSVTVGALIWYGSGQVLDGVVTIGVLVAFIEYMQKFFVPIRDLAQKYNLLQSAMASSERVFQLLDTEDALPTAADPIEPPEGALTLTFEDVWFAYNDEDWVLKGVSFDIAPGEKIAVVGHTGAGKSTVLNLLLRLRDPTRGRVLVNGVDARDIDIDRWRGLYSVVLQDAFLFRGTISENIGLGDPDVSTSDIEDAARTVRAHELISRYELGYEHLIRERGSNLSAGERQLVSFARALAHDPRILLLDEATANVDTETEALIQDALETLISRQTSLIIAHRLSTIREADRILVMHRGELVEQGSHDELIAHDGHYATLYRLQYDPTLDAH